jgi:predicted  nucleic acid-binding Zn-ribbon protein
MGQSAEYSGIVYERLETAINIGCTMVSRSRKVRKQLNSSADDTASLKKSLKELNRMSVELMDKLVEINARIDLPDEKNNGTNPKINKLRLWLDRFLSSSRKRIENMRLTYRDIYTL